MMRTHRALRHLFAILLLSAGTARASELSDDLSARRTRMMDRLGPDAMLIVASAPTRLYSLDIDYEYRQDSNLYYLTGIAQEETTLVLMPGNGSRKEILFIKDRNPEREHWTGRILSRDEAIARSGIQTVLSTSQFEGFLAAMLTRTPFGQDVDEEEAGRFFDALAAGRGRVAIPLDAGSLSRPLSASQELLNRLRTRYVGFEAIDATPLFTDLRLVKTPYEQKVLAKATEISGDAQMAGMRAARPGAYEYEVKAAIEAVHRGRGAVSWAYPSIVGSGPNATILHYPESERQMQAGDLLLVDAACNYQYMSPDITRTYPVSGTFTSAQKDIYAIVLEAQEEGMKVARPGGSLLGIHNRTVEVIKAGLLKLGLITDTAGDQYRMWYTHGASHYIGLDVHDVGSRTRPLQPGMTFVIEPGIYIRPTALDALPRTAENLALIEKVGPAVKKYADIGVRVEDSFLLEEAGLKRLSASVPRTIEEVEGFMRQRPTRSSGGGR
ncbi:MAG: M24 family metallopeptidase [Luteitalea sp.]|nr:M24 family metallopeptidase [Luteitalea sp.]